MKNETWEEWQAKNQLQFDEDEVLDYIKVFHQQYPKQQYSKLLIRTEFFRDVEWSDNCLRLSEHMREGSILVVRGYLADPEEGIWKNKNGFLKFFHEISAQSAVKQIEVVDGSIAVLAEYGVRLTEKEAALIGKMADFVQDYMEYMDQFYVEQCKKQERACSQRLEKKDHIIRESKKAYENMLKRYLEDLDADLETVQEAEARYGWFIHSRLGKLQMKYWQIQRRIKDGR